MESMIEKLKWREWEIYKWKKRMRLTNKTPTIIASNCVGTMIYHDMELPFYSPTINLFIYMEEFVRFVENLEWYLEQPLQPDPGNRYPYPVGKLGDIKVHFLHYNTMEEAAEKWESRKKRVDMDNLFVLGCERGKCDYGVLKQFESLPYKNKIVFTQKEYPEFSSAFYIKGFEDQDELGNVLEFKKGFWKRRYMDDFDYVRFFNMHKRE